MNDSLITDEQLGALLDGEATPEEVIRLSELLTQQPEMRSRLAVLAAADMQVRDTLDELTNTDGPDPLLEVINDSVAQQSHALPHVTRHHWLTAGALAAVVVIGVIVAGLFFRSSPPIDSWHMDIAAFHELHQTQSDKRALRLDITDEADLLPTAKHFLGDEVRIPQFIEAGYAVQGARINPTARGVDLVVLYYRPPEDWLTLGIRRNSFGSQVAESQPTFWRGRHHEYSLHGVPNHGPEQARLLRTAIEQTQ